MRCDKGSFRRGKNTSMRAIIASTLIAMVGLLVGPDVSAQSRSPAASQSAADSQAKTPLFDYQEVMVPMRDGIRLQTVIMRTRGFAEPLPILVQRTPYGVPAKAFDEMPPYLMELAADGYIFVVQNIRGRFKSEGTFTLSEDSRTEHGQGTI